jgi:hypothetical protein
MVRFWFTLIVFEQVLQVVGLELQPHNCGSAIVHAQPSTKYFLS